MLQPSYMSEIQIWLVSEQSRVIESRKKNESLQHNSMIWRCEILGEMNYGSKLENMSQFCYKHVNALS